VFGCFVVGASAGVAFFASGDEVVDGVVAATVDLDEVVGLGCGSAFAPMAQGLVA
jgi:hypothetical protein